MLLPKEISANFYFTNFFVKKKQVFTKNFKININSRYLRHKKILWKTLDIVKTYRKPIKMDKS